jgi:serine/threonine protein kinase
MSPNYATSLSPVVRHSLSIRGTPVSDNLLGARLGNYEIESPLGQGGMARVYKAWDTTLHRSVAIKVIEPGLSVQEKYRERFEREAQAVAALEHPHIVPVYYFGKTDSLYYLAMKFIEGEDLGSIMNRYSVAGEYLPFDDILQIIEGVVSALDYAHSKGVIHRDVKPSNIMIDREGHPYLTDFGLALDLSQGTVGDVLGTPHYVSPEQARNSANAVPQSDLYSLGVVLYELFTGVLPFDDPSPTAVALQHMMNEPPSPRALNPDLSAEIEAVILKAMAKNPSERYQNGKGLITALQAALQNVEPRRNVQEIPALPPLPPGVQAPAPRHQSTRSVAAEVRASLAQRATIIPAAISQAPTKARSNFPGGNPPQASLPAQEPVGQKMSYLPLLVLGIVMVVVILVVVLIATNLNNPSPIAAALPSQTPLITTVPPTSIVESEATATVISASILPSPTLELPTLTATFMPPSPLPATALPTATSLPPTLIPTPVPPSPLPATALPTVTSVPPTATSLPPTPTIIPPTPNSGPTAAPNGWLPVRFIYNADAFYWMNDSDRTISSKPIVFEQVGGQKQFAGNRFAYYSMEAGRCMQIMFADVARIGCPENRRPNAYFTPTRTQSVDFWTGGTGQFRVLWNEAEVAVCDISAGECSAFLPPG